MCYSYFHGVLKHNSYSIRIIQIRIESMRIENVDNVDTYFELVQMD